MMVSNCVVITQAHDKESLLIYHSALSSFVPNTLILYQYLFSLPLHIHFVLISLMCI